MTCDARRPVPVRRRLAALLAVTLSLAACVGAAGGPRGSAPVASFAVSALASPGSSGPAASAGQSGSISDASLKEALLARFGDLAFCDPDLHPIARADQATLARGHLAEMRADREVWTAIAGRLGFDAASSPSGERLVAAYRDWKMLRALELRPTSDGRAFDAVFIGHAASGATDPSASGGGAPASGVSRVVGTIHPDGSIAVTSQQPATMPPCPICLARGTLIATPAGDVAVETIRAGDVVWTRAPDGSRIAAVVVAVGSTPVPATHRVVRLRLADGRSVYASPSHPLADGRAVGSLVAGDVVDGSRVVSATLVSYEGGRTFDLLPAGGTGIYWAGGIPLRSTLVGS
jgi:Hint domain-containing protein